MAEIVISIAAKVAEYLVAPIGRQLGYLFNYHTNVKDLKKQLDKLEDVKGDVKGDVDAATRNGAEIKPVVERWLKSVDEIEEVGKFLDEEDKAKKKCFNGLCPNLKWRYQLSKKAKKTSQVVVTIQGDSKFDSVSYPAPSQGIAPPQEIAPLQEIAPIEGYEAFESRMSTLKEIMEALRNPSINMIGVYGMGGVGKTMLVKEVSRKAKEDKLFDKVVMTVVSQTPDLKKIQEEIADMLGMKFDWLSESGRAGQLRERLKQETSILVILDDIWDKPDLNAVGIPFRDDRKGCKIVVTSRNEDTLCNEMGAQKNFLVGVLSEQEAWNIFKKMAGDSVEATDDLKYTAIEVAKECAGLPIAIATVANALKNKSLPVWKNALQELRRSTPTNIKGVHAKVYSTLEWSYNSLESEEAKSAFLLCSLLPEDYRISIQDFLKYGKGLGLFQYVKTLEEARNKVHTLIHNLKASCLLRDSHITGSVQMHDVVRDVGISVASKEKNMLVVRYGVELEEWTTEGKLRICRALSLPYSDIHELPTGLECPELKLLLLLSKDPSMKIPDNFFEGMKQLKVLNLTNMCFSSLPSSIHFLTNLQTLCLDQCVLRDITKIGELKKLEIFSIQNSDIEKLPRERGQLTRLRMVEVKGCHILKNLFSLSMARSLLHLEEIETKHCNLMDAIFAEGREEAEDNNEEIVFRQLRSLTLAELPKLTSFCSKVKKMPSIPIRRQKLLTTDAWSEEIISEGEHDIPIAFFNEKVSFPNLEDLVIQEVSSLKEIWHYQLPVGSFCKLKHLKVYSCHKLRNIFTTSIAKSLVQLQELSINNCHMVEEIVEKEGVEEEATDKIVFPQLRCLRLYLLPKLMSFCSKVKLSTTDAGSKEIISEGEDDIPIAFFNEKVSFPNLEELLINRIPLKEIWHYQLPVGSFCKLKHLTVDSCDSLRNIFTTSITKSLVQLQELSIRGCDMVEEIVQKEGVEEEATDKIVFPQLRSLTLLDLPKLMSFCSKVKLSTTDVGSKEIISEGEDDIPIAFFNEKVAFPILEELILEDMLSMKEIWQGQFHAQSFCKLRVLKVSRCYNILKVLPISLLQNLQNLEELTVDDCSSLEEVFELGGVFGDVGHTATLPQLRKLSLSTLPKLVHLWKKDSQLFSKKSENAFPNLEELILNHLPNMKEIWQGQFHARSFCKLRVLEIWLSNEILQVFPISLLQNLQNLEELSVAYCSSLEIISSEEGEATSEITFSQLTSLELRFLPNLTSFCQGSNTFSFPSLEKVLVEECPELKTFSNGILSTPKLEKVQVQEDEWIWKGNLNTTINHLFWEGGPITTIRHLFIE